VILVFVIFLGVAVGSIYAILGVRFTMDGSIDLLTCEYSLEFLNVYFILGKSAAVFMLMLTELARETSDRTKLMRSIVFGLVAFVSDFFFVAINLSTNFFGAIFTNSSKSKLSSEGSESLADA
jgi:hypothetical protein